MPRKSAAPAPRRGRPRKPRPLGRKRRADRLTDAQLIARAIAATPGEDGVSPITDREFAERILICHPRTLRKYLEGRRLPALAREKLVQIVKGA